MFVVTLVSFYFYNSSPQLLPRAAQVAVKILCGALMMDPGARSDFEREVGIEPRRPTARVCDGRKSVTDSL